MDRKELRLLTSLLTGHGPWKEHLRKMGLSHEGNCRFYKEKAETVEHIWVECPALLVRRLRHLGKPTVTPDEVRELDPRKVIGFGKSLKLEWV